MSLIKFIQNNKDIRKIFGERELVIIRKQLLGVNLTQSERNRLSRDIRKKLNVIRDISRFESDFDLKQSQEVNRIVEETRNIIVSSKYRDRINKIILFGSTVDRNRNLNSDIDIAIEFTNGNKSDFTLFRLDMMKKVNDSVDIQVFDALPDKLKKEINEKGITIWKKE